MSADRASTPRIHQQRKQQQPPPLNTDGLHRHRFLFASIKLYHTRRGLHSRDHSVTHTSYLDATKQQQLTMSALRSTWLLPSMSDLVALSEVFHRTSLLTTPGSAVESVEPTSVDIATAAPSPSPPPSL